MLLRASTEFDDLVGATESSLKKIGIKYLRNRTQNLTEFEIDSPTYFRIVIESRTDPVLHNNPILPSRISKAKGCIIDIRLGSEENGEENLKATMGLVGSIMKEVVSHLTRNPWSEFGFMESERERKKWSKLIGK